MSVTVFLQDTQRRILNKTVEVRLESLATDDAASSSTDVAAALDSASAVLRAWPATLDGLIVVAENTRLSARGQLEQAEVLITERTTRATADLGRARQRLDAAQREAEATIERAIAAPLDGALAGLGVQVRDRLNGSDLMELRKRVQADVITARSILSAPGWLVGLDDQQYAVLRDIAAQQHAGAAHARIALVGKLREALDGLEKSWSAGADSVREAFERMAANEAQGLRQRGQPTDERGRPRRRAAG